MKRLKRVKPGQQISAKAFNALVDAVNAQREIAAAYPLEVHQTPKGIVLSLAGQHEKFHVALDEDLVDDGIATASVYSGPPGARVDTGINLEVSCFELEFAGGTIEEGTYCTVAWVDGAWDVMKRSCP